MLWVSKNMMRAFLVVLFVSIVVSGCNYEQPHNYIVNENQLSEMITKKEEKKPDNISVTRFNNGVILLKDKNPPKENVSYKTQGFSDDSDIKFGPPDLNFGSKVR